MKGNAKKEIPRKEKTKTPIPEVDGGYEKSHGYSPAHGGPSGPGDVPAQPASNPSPKPPEDETDPDPA